MRSLRILIGGLVLALCGLRPAAAYVELVTLPPRDTVQLTIYNSADLTLVRERRSLTLRKGENRLQFSWAETLIDPTSVELRPITHADQVEVLDTTFPANLPNNLVWHIDSEVEGEVQVEIIYFTSGISWAADYVIETDPGERNMRLAGYVTVVNRSGEDYPNAETRLVVGKINLVEEISDLARGQRMEEMRKAVEVYERFQVGASLAAAERPAAPKAIVKEGLSEYFLYSVEGRETIPDRWSKRLRSFDVAQVPVEVEYRFDPRKFGGAVHKFYTVKNSEKNKLGKEPLPDGRVMAFQHLPDSDRMLFAGQGHTPYVPIDEDIEVDLGSTPNVTLEAKRMEFRKENVRFTNAGDVAGHDTIETFRLRLRNGTDRSIRWEIRQYHSGDWELSGDSRVERENLDTVLLKLDMGGHAVEDVTYIVTTVVGERGPRPVPKPLLTR